MLASQAHEIVVPSYSFWFDLNGIAETEMRSLPEFFSGKNPTKTPQIYKQYRDFMVNTYRLNPTEYLTVTASRRNLAGDVCAMIRVHAFLEKWGLINYQIEPDHRPNLVGPALPGHYRIRTAMDPPPSLTEPTSEDSPIKVKGERLPLPTADATPTATQQQSSAHLAPSVPAVSTSKPTRPKFTKPVLCGTCASDCGSHYYHSLFPVSKPNQTTSSTSFQNICRVCFAEGRFPTAFFSTDFVRIETDEWKDWDQQWRLGRSVPWSDAETLLLLEAIELFDDDWGRVMGHLAVGGFLRTKEECVHRFLALPIEDAVVE
ncbi:Homeodomain-like protein, partial [Zopfochytrium polystomum]